MCTDLESYCSHRAINIRNTCKAHFQLKTEVRRVNKQGAARLTEVSVPSPRSSQTTGATEKILSSNIAQYCEVTQRDY